jgi:hypothetical protein
VQTPVGVAGRATSTWFHTSSTLCFTSWTRQYPVAHGWHLGWSTPHPSFQQDLLAFASSPWFVPEQMSDLRQPLLK